MALQGTLDTFSLDDVLQLLSVTGKTGCLHVRGADAEGRIWVDAGAVVGARSTRSGSRADVTESVFDLMRLERGDFDFDAGATAPDPHPPCAVADVLAEVDVLRSEWEELVAVVPTMHLRARLTAELAAPEVTVSADQWRKLATVIGPPSLEAVADTLEISEMAMARTAKNLVDAGLVELVPVTEATPDPEIRVTPDPEPEPEPEPAEAPERGLAASPPFAEPVELGDHLAGLSPRAAAAVAAAVPAGEPAPDEAASDQPVAGADDDERSSLMRFLSSART